MTDEKLDELWKILSSATNIKNLDYGEAVTIGSVFGEMKAEIKRFSEQNKRYREAINNIIEKAMLFGADDQVYQAIQDAIELLEGEE